MFGATRNVTPSLAGWLWADILLGLFVIFLAASSTPTQSLVKPTPPPVGIDPTAQSITLAVNGTVLLGTDAAASTVEAKRVADELAGRIAGANAGRRIAMILAYGSHEDPLQGDKLVQLVTGSLKGEAFDRISVKGFHNLMPGDRGTTLMAEVFFYR